MIPIIDETELFVLAWKDANLPTTPTPLHPESLIGRLIRQRPDLANVSGYKPEEFGLLNRLDNRTAGLVMVAKTNEAFEQMSRELRQEQWTKLYLAYCYDLGQHPKGVIGLPIAHHPHDSARMVIAREKADYRGKPQPCMTEFEKITPEKARKLWTEHLGEKIPFPTFPASPELHTWMLCRIRRGRRHQIRLHLKTLGYPILGDELYRPPKKHIIGWQEHHALYAIGIFPLIFFGTRD